MMSYIFFAAPMQQLFVSQIKEINRDDFKSRQEQDFKHVKFSIFDDHVVICSAVVAAKTLSAH